MNIRKQKHYIIADTLIPNYISIIWALMCIKNTLIKKIPLLYMIDYLIWIIVVVYFVFNNNWKRFLKKKAFILKYFLLLASIQIIGMIQNFSVFSVRNVISTLCVGFFLNNIIWGREKIQIHYIRIVYFLSIFIIIHNSMNGIKLDNTASGVLAFMLFGYIFMETQCNIRYKHINLVKLLKDWGIAIIAVCASLVATYIAAARTALFTILIIIFTFAVFSIWKMSKKGVCRFFYLVVGVAIVGVFIYINIPDVSWYNKLNIYSVRYFEKNINSSRPYLWKYSLESLKGWQMLLGKGTGILPDIVRYANSSFHNSFIQIIMQSGLLGLFVFMAIFKKIWYSFSNIPDGFARHILLAVMVGVIAYNCLESTLIQNKVFLGCIQWMILGMGVRVSLESKRAIGCDNALKSK